MFPLVRYLCLISIVFAASLAFIQANEQATDRKSEAVQQAREAAQAEAEEADAEASGTIEVEEGSAGDAEAAPVEPKRVFGWKEWIWLNGREAKVKAKLDTGAKTSSIHAEGIKQFEKDGAKWVRFAMLDPDAEEGAEAVRFEAPFVRNARIRNADGELSERIVVRLKFRISDLQREAEFTLNDRGDMIHAVLLGRTAISTLGLVDTTRIYLAEGKETR